MGTGALRVLSAAGRFQMVSESLDQGISLHDTSLAQKAKASTCKYTLRACGPDLQKILSPRHNSLCRSIPISVMQVHQR